MRAIWVAAMLFAPIEARAACTVSADAAAAVRPLNATVQADADLIVSMTLMPKLMHVDYASATRRPACDLGPLAPGAGDGELYGDDDAGRRRVAIPARKGDPAAIVIPVTNIMKAIDAAKAGKAASVEGYLLAVITKADFTGWRFYTGMPGADVLRHDMSEALAGQGTPIFKRDAAGAVSLFMPKGD